MKISSSSSLNSIFNFNECDVNFYMNTFQYPLHKWRMKDGRWTTLLVDFGRNYHSKKSNHIRSSIDQRINSSVNDSSEEISIVP